MADNITLNPGSGGDVTAANDIAGVKYQRVKVAHGAPGSATDTSDAAPFPAKAMAESYGDYAPNTPEGVYVDGDKHPLVTDGDGQLATRGPVLTDEGSYYTSFPGASVPADFTTVAGTGQTVVVSNSQCVITAGTTAGAEAYISIPIDYLPAKAGIRLTISQRIANQDIYFELADGATPAADTMFARMHWTGTTNTFVRCESQSSADTNGNEGTASDITQSATSSATVYAVELVSTEAAFYYGQDMVSVSKLVSRYNERPGIYDSMYLRIRVKNGTTPATSTVLTLDWVGFSNVNRLDVGSIFQAEAQTFRLSDSGNTVKGDKQTNTATPSAEAFEALPAVANAAAPSHSEGNAVALRTNLAGDLAVTLDGEVVTVNNPTAGNLKAEVSNAGTFAVQATLAAETTKVIGTVNVAASQTIAATQATASSLNAQVVGDVAHAGADASGKPVKIGAKAETSLAGATPVSDTQRTDLYADSDGLLMVKGFPEADLISERVSDTGGTSTAFTNFGATASARNLVYGYSVFNASATAGYLDFRDGTAGSILWTVPLPAGGGANIVSPNPIFKTTANTALAYDVSAALTTVYISVTGRKSKVT